MKSKTFVIVSLLTAFLGLSLFSPLTRPGWPLDTRERGLHPNPILDTFVSTTPGESATWEIALNPGTYYVTLACGDPAYHNLNRASIEGDLVINDVATASYQFVSVADHEVTLSDGFLTVEMGGTSGYCSIDFISISSNPPPAPPVYPVQVSFQPLGSTPPPAYDTDGGLVYDGGRGYGWDSDITSTARERAINPDQRLDTLLTAHPDLTHTWRIDLPNGIYFVEVACGDPSLIAGPHRVQLQGSTIIDAETTVEDQYIIVSRQMVSVYDGKFEMTIGGTSGYSEINYITITNVRPPITAETFPIKMNFQPAYQANVLGFDIEGGFYYTANRGYGFDIPLDGRVRGLIWDQLLDTLINTQPLQTATWNYDLPNGAYYCFLACGDAEFPAGPHRVLLEGSNVTGDISTSVGEFVLFNNVNVTVSDQNMTMQIGGLDSYTEVNYIIIDDEPKGDTTFPLYINFQTSSATIPGGYEMDAGKAYDILRGWGWSRILNSRERELQGDQRLDTLVFTLPNEDALWQLDVPNSSYEVTLSVGDAEFAAGPHRVILEGATVVNDQSTGINAYITVTDYPVTISDGHLTLELGGANGYSEINYIIIKEAI